MKKKSLILSFLCIAVFGILSFFGGFAVGGAGNEKEKAYAVGEDIVFENVATVSANANSRVLYYDDTKVAVIVSGSGTTAVFVVTPLTGTVLKIVRWGTGTTISTSGTEITINDSNKNSLTITQETLGADGNYYLYVEVQTPTAAGDITKKAYETVKDIVGTIMPIILSAVVLAGVVYSVVLGVNYAKAEDTEKREDAKKRLMGAIVGFGITIVLVTVLWILSGQDAIWESLFNS